MQSGIYLCTLAWHGRGEDPAPGALYSLLLDNDTESSEQRFHEPNDEEFWGHEYEPLTSQLCTSELDIAGAESGPSLAAPLPPGIKLVPK